MKLLAVLQARYSSSRLPGKVLKPILGEPMLYRQIERVLRSNSIDKLVVATSVDCSDDAIEKMCVEKNIDCFRGSLNDVLDRFYQVARKYNPRYVMRLTGDCPLFDPELADKLVSFFEHGRFDYAGNGQPPTYPDGLDMEVFTLNALEKAWAEAKLPSEREHMTMYIVKNPQFFKIGNMVYTDDLSDMRWTVDEPEDYYVVNKVYEDLYPANPVFAFDDVLLYLRENCELAKHNLKYKRNEGYDKSLLKDNF